MIKRKKEIAYYAMVLSALLFLQSCRNIKAQGIVYPVNIDSSSVFNNIRPDSSSEKYKIESASKDNLYFITDDDFGTFFHFLIFSRDLLKPNNKSILDSIKKENFNVPFSAEIDPAFAFLLENYYSKKEIKNDTLVDMEMRYTPRWIILADSFRGYYIKQSDTSYLIFYAHNMNLDPQSDIFHTFKSINSDPDIKAYNHGVLFRENEKYAWVFINDYKLMDGPEKLRWPSIEAVKKYKHLVIVLNWGSLYISDPDAGKVIKLHFDSTKEGIEENESVGIQKIEVENNLLGVSLPKTTEIIDLDAIIKKYF